MTIFSGQFLALLLMDGFNTQTTPSYRNCNTTCAEFSKTIFADFLEMNHCFDLAGWIVQCVGGFCGTFAISENAGISQEKGPFV